MKYIVNIFTKNPFIIFIVMLKELIETILWFINLFSNNITMENLNYLDIIDFIVKLAFVIIVYLIIKDYKKSKLNKNEILQEVNNIINNEVNIKINYISAIIDTNISMNRLSGALPNYIKNHKLTEEKLIKLGFTKDEINPIFKNFDEEIKKLLNEHNRDNE
jgi:hypothetical protein